MTQLRKVITQNLLFFNLSMAKTRGTIHENEAHSMENN